MQCYCSANIPCAPCHNLHFCSAGIRFLIWGKQTECKCVTVWQGQVTKCDLFHSSCLLLIQGMLRLGSTKQRKPQPSKSLNGDLPSDHIWHFLQGEEILYVLSQFFFIVFIVVSQFTLWIHLGIAKVNRNNERWGHVPNNLWSCFMKVCLRI